MMLAEVPVTVENWVCRQPHRLGVFKRSIDPPSAERSKALSVP
jgi:hypothetical protein